MHDRIMRWFGKFVVVFFFAEVGLSLLATALRHVTNGELWIGVGVISTAAYFIRKHRMPRVTNLRSSSSGERTPVMPRSNR